MNSRRVTLPAVSARLRQTRTMLDARTFCVDFSAVVNSVRIGQVPTSEKPALIIADSIVSQPVDAIASFFV